MHLNKIVTFIEVAYFVVAKLAFRSVFTGKDELLFLIKLYKSLAI